ncbi:MAG: DUF5011 domain-containing protein [Bacteroidota bacterium]|nr:DUF5011 domain-containing protein [Bacteroidota bacterium]
MIKFIQQDSRATNIFGRFRQRLFGFSLLAFFAIYSQSAQSQALSGSYTICASGCNYSTMALAVTDLTTKGVSGPVTFNLSTATYNLGTGVLIGAITGASSTNTITFQGTGRMSTLITGTGGTNGATIDIRASSWIRLKDLSISNTSQNTATKYALNIYQSTDVIVDRCEIKATLPTTGTIYWAAYLYFTQRVSLTNNNISGGYYALYQISTNTTTIATYGNNLFENNRITKYYYYGSYCFTGYNNIYRSNYVDSATNTFSFNFYSSSENGAKYINNTVPGYNTSNSGFYGLSLNTTTGAESFDIINNYFGPAIMNNATFSRSFYLTTGSQVNSNVKVLHNTIYTGSTSTTYSTYISLSATGQGGFTMKNNIFMRNTSTQVIYFVNPFRKGDSIAYNTYVNSGNSADKIDYDCTDFSAAANFTAFVKSAGHTQNIESEQDIVPTFVNNASDLRLNNTVIQPVGKFLANAAKDIYGNNRCTLFPPLGAHQPSGTSIYTSTLIKPILSTVDTVIVGSLYPVSITNLNEFQQYRFYVNGVLVSNKDSNAADFSINTLGKSRIKVIYQNCGASDSVAKDVFVKNPTAKPIAKFLTTSLNSILPGTAVQFIDFSTNGPSAYQWLISPDSTIINGLKTARYVYINGTTSRSKNPVVRFLTAGSYRVCLTVSNNIGSSGQVCKVDYISVNAAYNIGSANTPVIITDTTGSLFDDGGPNGLYKINQNSSVTIKPCPDATVYAVFKSFETECNYDYLRIYDGTDNTGIPLHRCTTNTFGTRGPGFVGRTNVTCTNQCRPNLLADTFVAKSGSIYVEWSTDGSGIYDGWEMQWTSKPKGNIPSKPTAKFNVSTNAACTNQLINFNVIDSGNSASAQYFFDFDGDLSSFESTNKNTAYLYTTPGTYTVTLVVSVCNRTDTFRQFIVVSNPPSPKAKISVDNTLPIIGSIVTITSKVAVCADTYRYRVLKNGTISTRFSFTGGTNQGSANPQFTFQDTGCYTIRQIVSNSTGTDSFDFACAVRVRAPYCVPTVSLLVPDLGIKSVSLNGVNANGTSGKVAYSNLFNTITKNVSIGGKFAIEIERPSNANAASIAVWVDFNFDGDFADAGELIVSNSNVTSKIYRDTISIPGNARGGTATMRIATNGAGETQRACGPNSFGEYIDVRLLINPDLTGPIISLIGNDTLKIQPSSTFTDPGATAMDAVDGDVTASITVVSTPSFNGAIPGSYIFTYSATDNSGNISTRRRIVVVGSDSTAPSLIVAGTTTMTVNVGTTPYQLPKVISANDNFDGDLSTFVTIAGTVNTRRLGTYVITYSVVDFSGNRATVVRNIQVVDLQNPVIALNGRAVDTLELGGNYNDLGVTVADNNATSAYLLSTLKTTNNIVNNRQGTYSIVYSVTDSANNVGTVSRTIIVKDRVAPTIQVLGGENITLDVNTTYTDLGVAVADLGPFNNNVTKSGTFYTNFPSGFANKLGTYTIVYSARDSAGNVSVKTRNITVADRVAPTISLVGVPGVNLCRFKEYTDRGYTVSDNFNVNTDVNVVTEGDAVNVQEPGVYTFRYKATDKSNNISYSDYRTVFVRTPEQCGTTAIDNQSDLSKAITVYPNPSTGMVNLSLDIDANQRVTIQVVNAVGGVVATVSNGNSLSQGIYTVDLSNQPSGIYLIQVRSNNTNVTKRVVIQK